MEKIKKYNLAVLITNWIRAGLTIISVIGTVIGLQYMGFPVEPVIFGGIAAAAVFNAIWFTVRCKTHAFGGGSLTISIVTFAFTLVILPNGISCFAGGSNVKGLILSIAGALAIIAGIIKLIYEIKLFKNRRLVGSQKVIPQKSSEQPVSTVKSKKKKNSETTQINPNNYEEFDLDHKGYLYLFGAFFIIFEKKCFGWRYIGKSKEGEVTRKGKVNILKYAWFSRAHELKTTKLFKVVEFISNIFIWLSNVLTSLILLVIGIVILLFILGSKNVALSMIISYVSMIAFNVLLALLGKLLFKVQKIRENNPPGFFDYLDSAVDEEREVMEQMRHEKEKQELVEEIKHATKSNNESSEAEKIRLLKEYKELLKDGTITKKEFEAKKKELLK